MRSVQRRRQVKRSVIAGAVGALGIVAVNSTATAEPASFAAVLAERFAELKTPGLGYAVVVDGRIVEQGGLGVADVHSGEPVSENTPFRVASLTKPPSAALLLAAVADGKLDLDTPLVQASTRFRERCEPIKAHFERRGYSYLRGIDCGDESVTLRTVATHTSRRPVGTRYRYNGFLFGLMGEAIANALEPGLSFEAVVRLHLIEPLALKRTAAGVNDMAGSAVVAALAAPHVVNAYGGWQVKPRLTGRISPAAGMISSAHDMARIDIAFTPGGLVTPDVWTRMTTPTVLADGAQSPYGLGWFVQELAGRKLVWHYGWQPDAYSALWLKDLKHRTSLILLANSDGLSRGYRLGRGDITRSPMARWFLEWSEGRR